MRVLMRFVATVFAFTTAVLAVLLTASVWIEEGHIGPVKTVALACLVTLAAFASVQLWRLKHSGRYAGLSLLLGMAVLMVVGRPPGMRLDRADLCYAAIGIGSAAILLLPASQRACS